MGHRHPRYNAKARASSHMYSTAKKPSSKKKAPSSGSEVIYESSDTPMPMLLDPQQVVEQEHPANRIDISCLLEDKDEKISNTKRKRLERYIEKKLKKEERVDLMKKLSVSSNEYDSVLMKSSKTLGTGKESLRERLRRAFNEERAGLPLSDPSLSLTREREVDEREMPKIQESLLQQGKATVKTEVQGQKKDAPIGSALKRDDASGSPAVGSALKKNNTSAPVAVGSALKKADLPAQIGSALKKPAPVVVGSALKRKTEDLAAESKDKKQKAVESSSDSDSDSSSIGSSEDESDAEDEVEHAESQVVESPCSEVSSVVPEPVLVVSAPMVPAEPIELVKKVHDSIQLSLNPPTPI